MNDIAGIPYAEAEFDKSGKALSNVTIPPGTTDLLVISHGWNNSAVEARALYRTLFENFASVMQQPGLQPRTFAIAGVIWPSKKFDEMVAVSGQAAAAGGAAGVAQHSEESITALSEKLDRMKDFFAEPAQHALIEEARALLPFLEDKGSARTGFVTKMRALLDPGAANNEDASTAFFEDDPKEIMGRLKVPEDDLGEDLIAGGGSMSLPMGVKPDAMSPGGAAGLTSFLQGFKASALNVLNYTTYYEMKSRAGTVGAKGVAPFIDGIGGQVQGIHLIGHSFGGRVVTAAAANSTTPKLQTMALLQAAFSHNGFSESEHGFFRSVVDKKRISGVVFATHTKNDKAVGVAYPLASRLNGDTAAAFGDENDKFGGIGRNGVRKMKPGEVDLSCKTLLASGSPYPFQAGRFFNLEASQYVPDHGGVTGKEIAWALRRAIG